MYHNQNNIIESVILNASAGCGKTRNIIKNICALLQSGVSPKKIMCISFTKSAAENMIKRLIHSLKKDNYFKKNDISTMELIGEIKFFTVHSFCFFLLKKIIKEMPDYRISEEFNYKEIILRIPHKEYSILDHLSMGDIEKFIEEFPEEILTQCSIKGTAWYIEALGRVLRKNNVKISREEERDFLEYNSQIINIAIFLRNYRIEKRGIFLFEDLIANTYKYLYMDDRKDWFAYLICKDTDHMFIDESQDISPMQWKILMVFLNEVFYDKSKTFFIAGDDKQSIFSFQNADYEFYLRLLTDLEKKAKKQKIRLKKIEGHNSSRIPKKILNLINNIFIDNKIFNIRKQETKKNYDGNVEFLELGFRGSRDNNLGDQIAENIKQILNKGIFLESRNRTVQEKDIMILFRKRGQLMQGVHDSLIKNQIASSGVDKIFLFSSEVCKFIVDVLTLCTNPTREILLIRILQNYPFFLTIDFNKKDFSIWDFAKEETGFDWFYMVDIMSQKTGILSPHNFIFTVFFKFQVYYKFIEKNDEKIVHEILAIAANSQYSSLWSFLDDFPKHVKKEQEEGVRLSTIHAAKGTQAPVVIIADCSQNYNNRETKLILDNDPQELELKVPVFNIKKYSYIFDNIKDKMKNKERLESYRELYVAITRSEELLYFCNIKPLSKDSWYSDVKKNMENV